MRRVILAILGTTVALFALLSFKSHPPQSSAGGLPSAALPSSATAPGGGTSAAPPDPSPGRTSGRVRATATATRTTLGRAVHTRYGVVQVKVVTRGTTITAVSFAQLTSFDGHSAQINSDAGPQLLQQTLTAQSTHVDGVSGATYTSDGYRQSLQYALDQVGVR